MRGLNVPIGPNLITEPSWSAFWLDNPLKPGVWGVHLVQSAHARLQQPQIDFYVSQGFAALAANHFYLHIDDGPYLEDFREVTITDAGFTPSSIWEDYTFLVPNNPACACPQPFRYVFGRNSNLGGDLTSNAVITCAWAFDMSLEWLSDAPP